ncbi:MAG TPA: M48 family metallopeptidase [Methylophilus sp.]|nr:M48 family metallopeptidase [Methylophilus sp.]HQQ34282.1 M48 family metallopeptidase [Methylophilus sp.]
MTFQADYFDGYSARASSVLVSVLTSPESAIVFESAGISHRYAFSEIGVQAKLGNARRLIDLPDGGRLEASQLDELEAAMSSRRNGFWGLVHYLENHLGWVMVALLATVFAGWMFLQFGVPSLAEYVAQSTPPSIERKLGEQVLAGFDHKMGYLSPSKVALGRQQQVRQSLTDMCAKTRDCPEYRLEFRDGEMIGPNAFALPGGIMVVTDGLVQLAKNNTELVAVLAHELGHVKRRHAFRQSIQGALAGLILAAITGDVSSMASGMPAALLQMRYSRAFEMEADRFAMQSMQKACLPPRAFADILLRLTQAAAAKGDKKQVKRQDPFSDMFSTHPDTLDRVKPFMRAKPTCSG